MDELIEDVAIALDEELSQTFTMRDDAGHVELVDGDLIGGTPAIAKGVLDALHERGWHFTKGEDVH